MSIFDPCFWRSVWEYCSIIRAIRVSVEDIRLEAYYRAEADGFTQDPDSYWLEAELTLIFARLLEAR